MKSMIKYIVSLAVIALSLVGCENGFEEVIPEDNKGFVLTIVADNVQRTEYDAALQDVKWSAEDKVNILVGGESAKVAPTIDQDNPRCATFTYNSTLSAGEVLVQGILDNGAGVRVEGNRATRYRTIVEAAQSSTTATFDKDSDILVADDMSVTITDADVAAGGKSVENFHFRRKVAITEFTYNVTNTSLLSLDERVESVSFEVVSADNDKFIAGEMYLQPSAEGAKYVDAECVEIADSKDYFSDNKSNKVTVTLTDQPMLKEGFKAWYVTSPVTLAATDKLIFTVSTTDGTTITKEVAAVGKELSLLTTKKNVLSVTLDESVTIERSIKLLTIGNSFSDDAMEYIYGVLEDAGYTTIVLGNLYIAGCTLEKHATNFASNSASYTYRKNTTGTWVSTASYAPLTALADADWDYISMQQQSGDSGMPETYDPYLGNLIGVVTTHCPNAKLIWHMTWAYQANSTHASFPNYNSDQMTMYNAIVSTVRSKILTNEKFVKVIPTGTAVQNMRTSFIGDNLTRDGYHMSRDNGRLLTAFAFAKALTGCDLSKVSYTPSSYTYSDMLIAAMKDAADKAYAKPFEVTASAYPPGATLQSIIEAHGYDSSKYQQIDLDFVDYAYYYSTSSSISNLITTGATAKRYVATKILEKSEIPNGALIVVKGGYQYRPEGWVDLNTKATTRPGNVTTQLTVVDDTWWSSWNYRAFNLAMVGTPDLTEQTLKDVRESFGVFVPVGATFEGIMIEEGYTPANYNQLNIEWNKFAYYYSIVDNPSALRTTSYSATTAPKYVATQIFDKSDIPNGSIIIVKSGYQYRPEGWVTLDTKNDSSARPANVSTRLVVVDDSWWGSWNYRAFNLSQNPVVTLTDESAEEVCSSFRIYTPKE